MLRELVLVVIAVGIIGNNRIHDRDWLSRQCNHQVVCEIRSTNETRLNIEQSLRLPRLRVIRDWNENATLTLTDWWAPKRKMNAANLRKVITSQTTYFIQAYPLWRFVYCLLPAIIIVVLINRSFRTAIIYPELVQFRQSFSRPKWHTLQQCLAHYCRSTVNRTVLQCHNAVFDAAKVRYENTVNESCMNRITYLDMRGSTINNLTVPQPFVNVVGLSIEHGRLEPKTIHQLSEIVPNLTVIELGSPNNLQIVIEHLIDARLPKLREISSTCCFYWPLSASQLEILDKQSLRTDCIGNGSLSRCTNTDHDDDHDQSPKLHLMQFLSLATSVTVLGLVLGSVCWLCVRSQSMKPDVVRSCDVSNAPDTMFY